MEKKLLKLLVIALATTTLFVGCGSNVEDKDKNNNKANNGEVVVDNSRKCSFPTSPTNASLNKDGIYKLDITVKNGNGIVLTDVVVTPALENNTITKAGDYKLLLTSPSCDNNATLIFSVSDYKEPTTKVGDEDILPF